MKQIFINLPVADMEKSVHFYTQLGFKDYPLFTGENQKCVIWGEQVYVMLQSKAFFGSFNKKPLADTQNTLAASFTLPVESLARMNEIVENGLKAGGKEPMPLHDTGFMQLRTLEDPDGHTWGIIHLDMEQFKTFKTGSST